DRYKTTRPLSQFDADALDTSSLLAGATVTTAAQRWTHAHYDGREKAITLFGGSDDSLALYRIAVEQGRYFHDDDFHQRRRVAVLGQEVWTELFESKPLSADLRVTIDEETFSVVGVLAHKPNIGGGNGTRAWDRRVLIPKTTF